VTARLSADTSFFELYDRLIGDETDVQKVLRHISDVVRHEFGAERTTVYLIDKATKELVSATVVANVERRIRVPISESSLAGYCALSARAFLVPDAYGDLSHVAPGLSFDSSWDEATDFRTRDVMCAPAFFKGEIVGVLQAMNSAGTPFTEADLVPLRSIARLVGYTLHHATLYEDIAELRQLEKRKAEFVRIMVHELKSPVAAAKMTVDVAEHLKPGPEELREFMGKIGNRMDQLSQMIADLLDLARIQSGDTIGEVGVFDLAAEAMKVADGYRESAEAKGLAFMADAPDTDLPVRFDSKGLGLVVSNLISNAVKYTASGRVEVRVSGGDAWATVEVSDTGMGIPEKDIPFMFGEFFRASNAKRSRQSGTGVGLAGIKRLAERFGGRIELRSVENEGSTFTVRLPRAGPDEAPAARPT